MPGDPHPIKQVTGLNSAANVSKAQFVAYGIERQALIVQDADELRSLDLTGQQMVLLLSNGRLYRSDTGDTTTEDDGEEFIRDFNGLGFEVVVIPGIDGDDGEDGAAILVQNDEPDTDYPGGSLWIDADSADLDLYVLSGSPLDWEDTGRNLRGIDGTNGTNGTDGDDGSLIFVQNSAPSTSNPAGSLWIDADSTDQDLYQLIAGSWTDTGVNVKGSAGGGVTMGQAIAAAIVFG